ncbi:tetratricopeptide repeat protein [Microvirga sp. 2MCAF35]|uniref:tetratricopeptide repeat protein n=1 Tax=Microvirga sp. 2MCAF35 TaxID=3232987 RepID=UPI003F9D07A2
MRNFHILCVFGLLLLPFEADATGIQARREYIARNYEAAFTAAQSAAENTDSIAMLILGRLYFEGKGVERDYAAALKWWRASADLGNNKAQNNIGLLYQYGLGVSKDYKEAARWFELSATNGEPTGYYNLSTFYIHGQHYKVDYQKALEFLKKSEALYNEELLSDPENSEAIKKGLDRVSRELALLTNHLDNLAAVAAINRAKANNNSMLKPQ